MTCPAPIAEALHQILYYGLVAIRGAGREGDAETCALEADHLHNIPHLIERFSLDRLRHYLEVERRYYLERRSSSASIYERSWQVLEEFLRRAQ